MEQEKTIELFENVRKKNNFFVELNLLSTVHDTADYRYGADYYGNIATLIRRESYVPNNIYYIGVQVPSMNIFSNPKLNIQLATLFGLIDVLPVSVNQKILYEYLARMMNGIIFDMRRYPNPTLVLYNSTHGSSTHFAISDIVTMLMDDINKLTIGGGKTKWKISHDYLLRKCIEHEHELEHMLEHVTLTNIEYWSMIQKLYRINLQSSELPHVNVLLIQNNCYASVITTQLFQMFLSYDKKHNVKYNPNIKICVFNGVITNYIMYNLLHAIIFIKSNEKLDGMLMKHFTDGTYSKSIMIKILHEVIKEPSMTKPDIYVLEKTYLSDFKDMIYSITESMFRRMYNGFNIDELKHKISEMNNMHSGYTPLIYFAKIKHAKMTLGEYNDYKRNKIKEEIEKYIYNDYVPPNKLHMFRFASLEKCSVFVNDFFKEDEDETKKKLFTGMYNKCVYFIMRKKDKFKVFYPINENFKEILDTTLVGDFF